MVYIAVLRIMQAFTEDFAYCCVTLKVPHLFAVATLLPSVAPSVALLFLRLPLFSFQGAEMRVTRQVFSPKTVAVNECTL
mgnify:CR=1